MAKTIRRKVDLPKWHLHDSGYITTMRNGKEHTSDFKNVCITDNASWVESEIFIWFRINRATEKQDTFYANLIANAPAMYNALKHKFPK